ncbi:MAG TPA: DUF3261 domain-containing protein [Myxococcota bacterium]|nr:DUF3261 domain-containing protein [Myxococcota bacterium]
MRRALVVLAIGLGAASLGCATLLPRLPPSYTPCAPAALVAPAELGADFRWRARASLRRDGEERAALDVVFEKRGDRLVLVAFDPFGARALAAVQEGDVLHVEPAPGRRRPVEAEALLADLGLLHGRGATAAGVEVTRDRTESGAERAIVRDARCGSEAIYVTVEERPAS